MMKRTKKSITDKNARVHSISLSIQSESMLRLIRKQSPNFNLSKFLDTCIKSRFNNISDIEIEVIKSEIEIIQDEIEIQNEIHNKRMIELQMSIKNKSTKLKALKGEDDW